ncbi:protoplasts-secreted [Neofusicoccum ribis]|uniref:Protoplasts-secreted n=1 Tax=Neofusicoccum ribis TaxID=45134 RepID=A0ABR3SP92_9PEZI
MPSVADATALAPCPTFTGNIQISSDAAGNISFDKLHVLNGNLLVKDANELVSLSADSLEQIEGYMYIQDLPNLSTLDFPQLTSVSEQLRLENLPKLKNLGFDAVLTECPLFRVTGTALRSIDGINPAGVTNGFTVSNNTDLQNITMTMNSTRLTSAAVIEISENSPDISVSFPNLRSSQNLEIFNVSSISLPELTNSNEIALKGNTFENFSAPKLTRAGNGTWGIWIEDCENLVNIEFPSLISTGGFTLLGSGQVHNVSLPKLQSSEIGFRLNGDIDSLSIPAVSNVTGDFALVTSSSNFDCSPFQALKDQDIIQGSFSCVTASNSSSGEPTASSSSSSSNKLSTGSKAGIGVGVGGATILLGLLLTVLLQRRHRHRKQQQQQQSQARGHEDNPPELGDQGEKKEMSGVEADKELPGSGGVWEMPSMQMHRDPEWAKGDTVSELEGSPVEVPELPGDPASGELSEEQRMKAKEEEN